ncbi:NAD-P-binding protein [Pilatotrama ljubarskyi]|nr:NAD-P-binding protein [Pilatotrama ljubarskyi]
MPARPNEATTSQEPKSPLRFGMLGAARVGPDALFKPAKRNGEVSVVAVACRDAARGSKYAHEHSIPKLYSGPQAYYDLLADPKIDVVYIPLPVTLHFEWSMRALEAGKHVLVEKPMTNTAEEARQIFALAEAKGLVALEAIHCTFHPVLQRVREIVTSGELGKIKSVRSEFFWPSVVAHFLFPGDDIRFDFDMGGGCMMDMGVYPLTAVRFVTGATSAPLEVTSATASGYHSDPTRIDRAMHATYALPDDITAETIADLSAPGWGPLGLIPRWPKLELSVSLEGGDIQVFNFIDPGVIHWIKVRPKGGANRKEKVYTYNDGRGEKTWHSYDYQLRAFVDKVRGRTPWSWTEPQSTITQLETMERVYLKAGMTPRKPSSYVHGASENAP